MCTQQGVPTIPSTSAGVPKSNRLKVRVTRLESVVERLAKHLPQEEVEKPQTLKSSDHVTSKVEWEGMEKSLRTVPPLYALFQSEMVIRFSLCKNSYTDIR